MKPTFPVQNNFGAFATVPYRGLSQDRLRRDVGLFADKDGPEKQLYNLTSR